MQTTSRTALALAALASAALFYFGIGLNGHGALVWLAPLPVLAAALGASCGAAAAASFLALLLGALVMVPFLLKVAPPIAVVGAVALPAAFFALCVLAARRAVARHTPALAVLAFPTAWTAYEFVSCLTSPHGTAGSLAYTQTDFLPLLQTASLAGWLGVTFLLTLAPSAAAVAWHLRARPSQALQTLAGPAALFLLVLAWGGYRLATPPAGPPVRVGLASTDATVDLFRTEKAAEALPVVEAYARRVSALAAQGASVVVLPEKFIGVTPAYEADADRLLATAARNGKVAVVAGLNRIGRPEAHNSALVFGPDGTLLATYEKIHLLPGFEDQYPPGRHPADLNLTDKLAGQPAGVAICKDMDFPTLGRAHGQAGAGLLLVPAWDFVVDGRRHSRMAVLRGVESGFAVARAAQNGLLTVSDDRGRILAETASSPTRAALVLADVHPGHGNTFYSRIGDWLGWLALAGLAALLVLPIRRGRRE